MPTRSWKLLEPLNLNNSMLENAYFMYSHSQLHCNCVFSHLWKSIQKLYIFLLASNYIMCILISNNESVYFR